MITSRRNPLVERVRRAARTRPAGTVLLDGPHLIDEAVAAGLAFDLVAGTERALARGDGRMVADGLEARGIPITRVTDLVLDALSPSTTASGMVALARLDEASWDALVRPPPALVLVAIDVQDPGNLGGLVRAAEAVGATGVVASGAAADPFGWKALRGAMGSAFRLAVRRERSTTRALDTLRGLGLQLLATAPTGGTSLEDCDLRPPTAVLLGSEAHGLEAGVLAMADRQITIPMRAPVASLNVAVAGALIAFEAARQRSR